MVPRHYFDRHGAVQAAVMAPVNLAHASTTDVIEQFNVAKPCPGTYPFWRMSGRLAFDRRRALR
ncbi:MAG: hypothetical protein ACOX1P_23670 [Thermoguttaceae bacterium]